MSQKQISQYLFEQIKETGVDCTFGIPGDFVMPIYAAQQKSGLHTVVMTHEPSVGFAADAYARIKGLGVALVTYGAGGLNMINSTALAYAEELPLLVIGGGPEVKYRSKRALLHHCVKTFDTQNNVYEQVTAANAIIDNVQTAKRDIDKVLETVLTYSRPGYLEIPRDMVDVEIEISDIENKSAKLKAVDREYIQSLIQSICERISNARQVVIMTGVQISRFGLLQQVCEISEALNIPVISSLPGKSAFPESHPNFIGVYYGQFGDQAVQKLVESSDCIIALGSVLNEIETGGFTAKFPVENLILINNEEISIGQERNEYDPAVGPATVQFKTFLSELSRSIASGAKSGQPVGAGLAPPVLMPSIMSQEIDRNGSKDNLTVAHIIASVNDIVDENTAIVCDVGDCLYAGMSIKTDCFIAPGYYCTMGFGVPGGIGVQLADKKKRPLVLVGDGAFQMTGTEISTAVKEKLNPIIVIFNNASYAMLKFMDISRDQDYYKLPNWDYVSFARALGAEGYQAQTRMQFDLALQKALKSEGPVIIDAQISPDDISPTLRRMTEFFGNKMRAGVKA